MIEITEDQFDKILYHLDGFMRLMGYGREYQKIYDLVKTLPISEEMKEKYYEVHKALK
jgi:hypothetical protein